MNKQFFIDLKGQIIDCSVCSHISTIIEKPYKFGLTNETVRLWYSFYNEPIGLEGKAREYLIKTIISKGFIKGNYYEKLDETWLLSKEGLKKIIGKQFI
jgi:hypothetical protein